MKEYFKNYMSKGKHIAKSSHHKDMFIITAEDGIHFHTITSTDEHIRDTYPPDPIKVQKRVRTIRKSA